MNNCHPLQAVSFPSGRLRSSMAASKHIAHTLLLNAHPPETASAIFTEKVLHKPLHLRPTSPDLKSRDARAQRRLQRLRKKDKCQRRQKLKTLSAKEKRVSGIYDIPKNGQQYDTYVPLHRMWVGYMWEILGMNEGKAAYVTGQTTGSKLASADYHGAEITVVRSPCTGLVGLAGIVVRDTKFTFQIITKKNQLKTVPKKHTIFRFEIRQPGLNEENVKLDGRNMRDAEPSQSLKPLVFELHGSQFENRATDRATKKFKPKNMADL